MVLAGHLNLPLLHFLCFVTSLPARDVAALTFDAWLLIAVDLSLVAHIGDGRLLCQTRSPWRRRRLHDPAAAAARPAGHPRRPAHSETPRALPRRRDAAAAAAQRRELPPLAAAAGRRRAQRAVSRAAGGGDDGVSARAAGLRGPAAQSVQQRGRGAAVVAAARPGDGARATLRGRLLRSGPVSLRDRERPRGEPHGLVAERLSCRRRRSSTRCRRSRRRCGRRADASRTRWRRRDSWRWR